MNLAEIKNDLKYRKRIERNCAILETGAVWGSLNFGDRCPERGHPIMDAKDVMIYKRANRSNKPDTYFMACYLCYRETAKQREKLRPRDAAMENMRHRAAREAKRVTKAKIILDCGHAAIYRDPWPAKGDYAYCERHKEFRLVLEQKPC